jgi:hypothetical protein
MSELVIEGGNRLNGELEIQGAKNGVLPVLAATLLCADTCRIEHCPRLRDVDAAIAILRHLGCRTHWEENDLVVDTGPMDGFEIPDALMREMRSSVIFLGAILARTGEAVLSYPGGCELGPRPIDIHLSALRALGAQIEERGGLLRCQAQKLTACEIVLPLPSVGATENAILAACGAKGTTVIYNAAREPEIVELQDFLNAMGAQVCGAGGSIVTVEGRQTLHGCTHRVIADRLVFQPHADSRVSDGQHRADPQKQRPLAGEQMLRPHVHEKEQQNAQEYVDKHIEGNEIDPAEIREGLLNQGHHLLRIQKQPVDGGHHGALEYEGGAQGNDAGQAQVGQQLLPVLIAAAHDPGNARDNKEER